MKMKYQFVMNIKLADGFNLSVTERTDLTKSALMEALNEAMSTGRPVFGESVIFNTSHVSLIEILSFDSVE